MEKKKMETALEYTEGTMRRMVTDLARYLKDAKAAVEVARAEYDKAWDAYMAAESVEALTAAEVAKTIAREKLSYEQGREDAFNTALCSLESSRKAHAMTIEELKAGAPF